MRPIVLILLVACTPSAPVPAPVAPLHDADAALGTPCQAACSTLASLGCAEGATGNCVAVYAAIDGARNNRIPSGPLKGDALTCAVVASARSQSEVRALGILCPGNGGL